MAVPLEQFVKQLEDSGILAGDTIQDFIPPKADPGTAEELARELVRQKKLTKFQAEEVYRGKAKSLVLGNYVLMEKIGAGGMGQVFKAEHRRMHRIVAVKVLPAKTMKDPATVARFEREVTAAAKISHPNIVTAFDADQANGIHFLVMELVEGSDLSALVKKNGPFPVDRAVNYLLQAARGLEAAHAEGIVHRDIKPANLLLDRKGTVKVLDMGLARINGDEEAPTQAELTGTGMVMGTVDYMAPEQALSTKTADARADIYALGCSLYYLLTGKAAYGGETLMAKLLAHREEPIPSLRASRPEVSESLEAVFQMLVAKKVQDRYQTMTEVIAALERCVSQPEPTMITQPSLGLSGDTGLTNFLNDVSFAPKQGIANKKTPKIQVSSHQKIGLLIGGGLLGVLLLFAVVVVNLNTKDGTLIVTVNEPGAEVQVLNEEGRVEITGKGEQGPLTIAVDPGKHRLKVTKDGFALFTQDFSIEEKGQVKITAKLLPVKSLVKTHSNGMPSPDQTVLTDAIDFDAERKAAEWVLSVGGAIQLLKADGTPLGLADGKLPAEPFAIGRIDISGNHSVRDEDLARLSSCRSLRVLVLHDTSLDGSGLRYLKSVASLLELVISSQSSGQEANKGITDQTLAPIQELHQLRNLSLPHNYALTDDSLSLLTPLTKLQYLGLDGLQLTDAGMKHLDALDQLATLNMPGVSGVTDDGVRHSLIHHPKIIFIWVSNDSPNQHRTVAPLGEGKALESVRISGDQLTAATLPSLLSLEKLNALILDGATDDNITQLSHLPGIKRLECYWFHGGPDGFSPKTYQALSKHPGLDELHLHGNSASPTDENLLVLAKSPRLKFLILSFGNSRGYTPAGIAKFRELRPDMELLVDGTNYPATAAKKPLGFQQPGFDDWVKDVAALPAEEQVDAVSKKLIELNPGFDGKVTGVDRKGTPKIENGVVTELAFLTEQVADISPVRALTGLKVLTCSATDDKGELSDLTPLKGMKLTSLDCNNTNVSDLSPLAGMVLTSLECHNTHVSDLSPLRGMPLTVLNCGGTGVSDLSPLNGMPLTWLWCGGTHVSDLSPLQGLALFSLYVQGTPINDFSPLKSMTLKQLGLDFKPLRDADIIRSLKTLETINGKPAAEFWQDVEQQQTAFQQWMNDVAAMPAEEQVQAIRAKLMELNPGFDGTVTPSIQSGVVYNLNFSSDHVTDISPVRALTRLSYLSCRNLVSTEAMLTDLSPLKGLSLKSLAIQSARVVDLSPLKGMPLERLYCGNTPVADLSPLKGMPLEVLSMSGTRVPDLSQLEGMPLKSLLFDSQKIKTEQDLELLRSIKTLEMINEKPAAEFWKAAEKTQ